MLQALKLLLPAIIPSWRFFDVIAPSPRIEFSLLKVPDDTSFLWQEFRPRPVHLSLLSMFKRMIWNPSWNETLFLVSCAERLMKAEAEHSEQEILNRIRIDLRRNLVDVMSTPYLQFRLVFVSRGDGALQKHVTYVSSPCCILEEAE